MAAEASLDARAPSTKEQATRGSDDGTMTRSLDDESHADNNAAKIDTAAKSTRNRFRRIIVTTLRLLEAPCCTPGQLESIP
jgi:hypothetical protein